MDRKLDREFGVSVVIAPILAIAIKAVAQIQVQNELSAQPDLSWLVSP